MAPRQKLVCKNSAPFINPDTSGIDIGAVELYVAVPSDRSDTPVRCFGTFTEDLLSLAEWLKSCGVRSVAMESTGVYWIPIFQILEAKGFEVCLVNARHVKNVPGRKTDVSDCQWLQYLHSVGLLRGSFRPPQQVCAIRSLGRHRDSLIQMASVHIQHMQKALTQMNLQLHHVISDITGVTGLNILDAILSGERDPETLAKFRNPRIRASKATVVKSLVGDFRDEHLFTLDQSLQAFRHYQGLIAACDQKIKALLQVFDSQVNPNEKPLPPSTKLRLKTKEAPSATLRTELYRITGVDLTEIPGIQATTAHTLIAEVGTDMSKFPSAKHFASWLGLCPDNRVSGGKILSVKTRAVSNRAAGALRIAAQGLYRNESALGGFFRRMRAKQGAPKAITSTAHKLALVIYHMLKDKTPYDHTRFAHHEQQHKRRMEVRLKHQAKAMGFALVPA
jgi:transposase